MPLNVTEEEVDKVNERSDTGSSADNLCPQYSLRLQGQLSNLINFRYSLHENPILFPQKIEQLWFAKPFFSIF